jgi:predicted acylesterase/phospholipase RssA
MNKVLKRNITKLLICGGGFKFFYIVGALKYLDELNILQNINEYIGVSAGAVLSLFFNIGYTLDELDSFFLEFNFEKLIDPHIDSLLDNKGLDNGELKKTVIQHFLQKKNIDPEITFLKLYELTNIKLTLIVSNLTSNKLDQLNYIFYPDMPVWQGLLITTALPILFEPIIYNDQYLIDGGVFDNYPIELFHDEHILGINLLTDIENVDFNTDCFNYLSKLIILAYNWKNNNKASNFTHCTIQIKTYNPSELIKTDVPLEERIDRINRGYEAAKEHFINYELLFEDVKDTVENIVEDIVDKSNIIEENDNITNDENVSKIVDNINYIV